MSTASMSSRRRRRSQREASRRVAPRLAAGFVGVISMCLAGLCFWLGLPALMGTSATQTSLAASAEPRTEYRENVVPIRDVEVSYGLPFAPNPTGELDDSLGLTVDPPTWRKLTLKASKPDGSHADVWLLRPLWWLEEYEAEVGETIELSIPEVGIDGPAELQSIEPCPDVIKSPNASIVTGKFVHHNAKVLDVQIADEQDVIGTTPNHPFWSEDRYEFIEAGKLKIGEKLRRLDGSLTHVASIIPRPGLHTVYNLEVQVDHVYHVGETGVLVHNTYPNAHLPTNTYGSWTGTRGNSDFTLNRKTANALGLDQGTAIRFKNGRVDFFKLFSRQLSCSRYEWLP